MTFVMDLLLCSLRHCTLIWSLMCCGRSGSICFVVLSERSGAVNAATYTILYNVVCTFSRSMAFHHLLLHWGRLSNTYIRMPWIRGHAVFHPILLLFVYDVIPSILSSLHLGRSKPNKLGKIDIFFVFIFCIQFHSESDPLLSLHYNVMWYLLWDPTGEALWVYNQKECLCVVRVHSRHPNVVWIDSRCFHFLFLWIGVVLIDMSLWWVPLSYLIISHF